MDKFESEWNESALIRLKPFSYRGYDFDKSYVITDTDLLLATTAWSEDSISLVEAIKLRWELGYPRNERGEFTTITKYAKMPLHQVAIECGKKLWIDPNELAA